MRRALVSSVLLVAVLSEGAACSRDDGGQSASCDPETAQPIDPLSSQHLLPGAPEPAYNTEPPTSGAHRLGEHPMGVLDEPIERPIQVAMLEGGAVLLQYTPAIAPAERRALETLVSAGNVSVAPNDSLESPIVATAWLHMLRCDGLDSDALREFVDDHAREDEAH